MLQSPEMTPEPKKKFDVDFKTAEIKTSTVCN